MFGDPVKNSKNLKQKDLSTLGKLERGVSKFRPRNAPELLDGPYPLVQTGDIANSDIYITRFNSTYSELGLKQSKLWPSGTLCITIAANIAKTGILTFDACFPDSIVGFIPEKNVNILYIHFWFKMIQQHLESLAPSTAQKNINLSVLSGLKVICPSFSEQNKFSEILSQADKSKFTRLKSQFIEMFGTLDNPKGKMESLGSMCNIQRGGSPRPISEYITDQSDGLNWIKIGDTDDSMYITKTEEKIKPSGLRKTRQVYAGDLLLSNSMSFGRSYILKIDGCIHDGWLVLHINDAKKLSPVYLCSYLSQQGTYAEMAKLAAGGVVQNLNSNIVKQLDVIVPDMEEQIKYIQILDQADKSKYIN